MVIDTEWAVAQLTNFVELTTLETPKPVQGVINLSDTRYPRGRGTIPPAAQIIEQILDRVLPDWKLSVPIDKTQRWQQHREAAQRAVAQLERDEEIQKHLGDTAPKLDASKFHHWIWEGARSLWNSRHFGEAVRAASVKLNAETQNKLGTRSISETSLFQQAFSSDEPSPTKPRLRLPDDVGAKTDMSIRRGIMAFAEGCYSAIRNPISHEPQNELSEDEAMEQLAALSLLARWVDAANVVRE